MTAPSMAEQITADFAYAESHLRSIKPVPHHEWVVPPGELCWFAGDVLTSVAHGASIFLHRTPADPLFEDQLHIEVMSSIATMSACRTARSTLVVVRNGAIRSLSVATATGRR